MQAVSPRRPQFRWVWVGWCVRALAAVIQLALIASGRPKRVRRKLRVLQILGGTDRRCEQCVFFDHTRGQELIQQNSAFAEATKHLSPGQMASVKTGKLTEDGQFPDAPNTSGYLSHWDEFGACSRHLEGVDPDYVCGDWQ